MASKLSTIVLLLSTLASLVTAQQGVLVNGKSQLPACAQSCQALQQAAQACPDATSASANQASWVCFCQSAYLTNLKNTASASSVCSTACTNPSDNSQIATWYTSNCGSDFGASEHAGNAAASTTVGAASTASASASSSAAATASNVASGSDSNSGSNFSAGSSQSSGDWWSNHYKWIIMLIVLAVALPLLAWLAIWLKRRHDRQRDQISEGFNAGITHRAPPPMSDPNLNASGVTGSAAAIDGSGRNSPARTRDAFMPYGYGYNRSESRFGSKQAVYDDRRSPLARGDTPLDPEKELGMGAAETPETGKKRSKRVLVRERSAEDSIETEKR